MMSLGQGSPTKIARECHTSTQECINEPFSLESNSYITEAFGVGQGAVLRRSTSVLELSVPRSLTQTHLGGSSAKFLTINHSGDLYRSETPWEATSKQVVKGRATFNGEFEQSPKMIFTASS